MRGEEDTWLNTRNATRSQCFIAFFLDDHAFFHKIPDMLDRMYTRVVQHTAVDQASHDEAEHYRRHS